VFLMGLRTIDALTSGLLAAGLDAATPAALIENGTRSDQRHIISTAAEISTLSKTEKFSPPATLIVGGVCSLSEKLDWSGYLPLKGAHIIVTRPKEHGGLSEKLRNLGANVMNFPCIRTVPLPVPSSVSQRFADYGWIVFTSPTGAELFFENLKAQGMDIRSLYRVKFAAIGEKTAEVIKRHAVCVDYMPEIYNARELADGLPLSGDNPGVLLFRARDGTPQLESTLRERGFLVEDLPAYETICECENAAVENVSEMISRGKVDFVTFTSASIVESFVYSLAGFDFSRAEFYAVCIGQKTAAAAQKHGLSARVIVSEMATAESMIECIKARSRKARHA
jgi:uroporphyrinogen III methyltransferase/synthase